jgi:diguanylate cyclase (GGDEF)-like protein/PAS domain S-box-containing protein
MEPEVILIVDDNHEIADFCGRHVIPHLGYNSRIAYTARQGFQILKDEPIALLLLDYNLPDMSGLDLLRKLWQEGINVPSILITAEGSEQIAAEAFRLGVEDYLPKPIETDQLSEAIQRALAKRSLHQEKERLTLQLKEQLASQTVLSRVGRSLTSSLDLDEVLRRIVEAAVYLARADEGFIALLEQKSGKLYLRASKNIEDEKSKTIRLPVNDPYIGQVFQTRKPIRSQPDTNQSRQIKVSTGYLVNSVLHVPILSRDQSIGVLSVINNLKPDTFKDSDEANLLSLSDYASVALENAQLYSNSLAEIDSRRRAEEALRASEERFELAVRGANDGIWDWDMVSNEVFFSPRWKSMLGYEDTHIASRLGEWLNRVHPEDLEGLKLDLKAHIENTTAQLESEYRMLHRDGSYRWILCRGLCVRDENGVATRMAGSQSDITDRKYAEEKLLRDAFYDLLTGLPNRALFVDHLSLAVERAKRRKEIQFAVLFLDLDRFKDVNDSMGHNIGDELLILVARKLETRLRTTDTVARFGGDEFVILLDDIQSVENAEQIAKWVLNELKLPFSFNNREVYINASIGIAMSNQGYTRAEEVLRDADIAMYNAKARGKARYEIFHPSMREFILSRTELEHDLRRAIEHNELRVYYQFIVSLDTRRIVGVEALVRWEHPRRGLLPPIEFIPVAEESGLIAQLDRWVMRQACEQLQTWKAHIPEAKNLTLSVNISSKHIVLPDLPEFIENLLAETGIDPGALKLEITESAILEKSQITNELFNFMREIGVQLQIDDFGTGYSALSYLSNFPINALKIDRSFIQAMGDGNSHAKIVQAIVMLSQRLGVNVIAEGIEHETLVNQLKEMGCEFGQGFFFAKPMSSESVTSLLEERLKHSTD